MKKRLFSLLLCAALLLALLPAAASPASATQEIYDSLDFVEVSDLTSLRSYLESGAPYVIKLAGDIFWESEFTGYSNPASVEPSFSAFRTLEVRGRKLLDLNGHTLEAEDLSNCSKMNSGSEYYIGDSRNMFHVNSDAELRVLATGGGTIHFNGYIPGRTTGSDTGDIRFNEGLCLRNAFDVEGVLHINGGTVSCGGYKARAAHGYSYNSVPVGGKVLSKIYAVVGGSALRIHNGATVYVNGGTLRGRGSELNKTSGELRHTPVVDLTQEAALIVNGGKFEGFSGASIFPLSASAVGNVSIRAAEFELDSHQWIFCNGNHECCYGFDGSLNIRGAYFDHNRAEIRDAKNGVLKEYQPIYTGSSRTEIYPKAQYPVTLYNAQGTEEPFLYRPGSSYTVKASPAPYFSVNEAEYSREGSHGTEYIWSYAPADNPSKRDALGVTRESTANLRLLFSNVALSAQTDYLLFCTGRETWQCGSAARQLDYTTSEPLRFTASDTAPSEDICDIDIGGVTAPVSGAKPDVSGAAPGSEKYMLRPVDGAVVTWFEMKGSRLSDGFTDWGVSPESVFDAAHMYAAKLSLQAVSGNTFAKTITVRFNGAADPERYTAEYLSDVLADVWLVFDAPQPDPAVITEVRLSGFAKACVAGQTPSACAPVVLTGGETRCAVNAQLWGYEDGELHAGGILAANEPFERLTEYSQGVELKPAPGFRFAENCAAVLENGALTASVCTLSSNGNLYVYARPLPACDSDEFITDVRADCYVGPVAGMKVEDALGVEVGDMEEYLLTDLYWYDLTDGRRTDPAETFEAEHTYQLRLSMNTYVFFAEQNGSPAVRVHIIDMSYEEQQTGTVAFGGSGFDVQNIDITMAPVTVAPDSNVIYRADLEAVTDCFAGRPASGSVYAYAAANYSVRASRWICDDTGEAVPSGALFTAGNRYHLQADVMAKSGFSFDWGASAVLNGTTECAVDFPDETDLRKIRVNGPVILCEARTAITHAIFIDAVNPVAGTTAEELKTLRSAEESLYYVADQSWFNAKTGIQLSFSDTFEVGVTYALHATLCAGQGMYFAENCTFEILGDGALASAEIADYDDATVYITLKPAPCADPCAGYADVNRALWYHSAVDYVISHGLMGSTKTDALTFEPDTKVSRAMVASILYRMADSPYTEYKGAFKDVPAGKWFTAAVEWCAQNGLAAGKGDGKFDPNGNVTRQELAVFMKKTASYLGRDTSGRDTLESFADAAKVPAWAKEYVQWAVSAGLISGKASNGKTCLAPADNATRAELAAIIMRFAG